jgi:hypothetical protein
MLVTGGLLTAIALLTLVALVPVFHSSNPPRWTTRGWIGELVTVSIVCTLALGLGFLGAGAIGAFQTGPDWLELGLMALVLSGSIVIYRQLRAARPQEAEPPANTGIQAVGTTPGVGAATSARVTAQPPPPHKAA